MEHTSKKQETRLTLQEHDDDDYDDGDDDNVFLNFMHFIVLHCLCVWRYQKQP